MNLVLGDIARWKEQLESEVERMDAQMTEIDITKAVALQKIGEASALLEEMGFDEASLIEGSPIVQPTAAETAEVAAG